MSLKIYVPEGVDLEGLETRLGFREKVKHYKRDKLAYILSLPNHIATYDKRRVLGDGFVPIMSSILQDIIGANYKHYLDLLVEAKILERNASFVIGRSSKHFRLSSEIAAGVVPYEIKDKVLKRALNRNYKKIKGVRIEAYPYLTKWFQGDLRVNKDLASEFLVDELLAKMLNPELRDVEDGKEKSPEIQYNSSAILIDCINSGGDVYLSVDESGNRFHSPLTNIRSILRNAITYNGKKLVSIDIKNSQPFFSSKLLQIDFWEREIMKPKYISILNSIINNHQTTTPIMLQTIGELLKNPDVEAYIKSVTNGFYEEFEEAFKNRYLVGHNSRKELKTAILKMLYSKNRSFSREKTLFGILYPSVLELFTYIKHEQNELLPILLQRIESEMVLDDIALHFSETYPELPIFTIHDSLVTLASDYDKLLECILERFQNRMGIEPRLSIETWDEENLIQHHKKLINGIIS